MGNIESQTGIGLQSNPRAARRHGCRPLWYYPAGHRLILLQVSSGRLGVLYFAYLFNPSAIRKAGEMPIDGLIPDWLFSSVALVTLWLVMFNVGLSIMPGEFRWVVQRPAMLLKGLFAVLVVVPVLTLTLVQLFRLGHAAEVGIVLMAISPGAPVALRRSLGAGGHRSYATALQIAVAALAVVSMPIWIAVLDYLYDANASISPWKVGQQVFMAQLLPLGIGILLRRSSARAADVLLPKVAPLSGVLLLLFTLMALIDVWQPVVNAGPRASLAIVTITLLALACGHLLGGPDPTTRTATAVASAARNPGLALLVASLNKAQPAVMATVLAYLVICALTVLPYVIWRRRHANNAIR